MKIRSITAVCAAMTSLAPAAAQTARPTELRCQVTTRTSDTVEGTRPDLRTQSQEIRYRIDRAAGTISGSWTSDGRPMTRTYKLVAEADEHLVFCESLETCMAPMEVGETAPTWQQVNLLTVIDLKTGKSVRVWQRLGFERDKALKTTVTAISEGECKPG